ncbi:CsbD family protein [Paracoccus salsus]|uniref:CsbD family protein n=1 Tax=Paracoccus salsus TaxID=2911061 RepID=UPI001F2B2E3E|nr:CsbD family protein [Paracoccus salsus]MCF3973558.1 CsbD family protein [Paracoccus salsus]
MNWDIVKGKWKQLQGSVQEKWGELTNDDLDQIDGNKDQLAGKLQEKYGWTKEKAESEIDDHFRDQG